MYVHGWQTDGPDAEYTLFSWLLDGDAGNMTATGPPAVLGGSGTVTVSWNGDPESEAATHGTTLVRVDS